MSDDSQYMYAEVRQATFVYVPAQRRDPYNSMPEANKEEDEKECVDLNHLGMKVPSFRDHKVCLERTHAICEDPNSTSEEKTVAIEALKEASKSLNKWAEYYSSIQQVHLDALTTEEEQQGGTDLRRSSRNKSRENPVASNKSSEEEKLWVHGGDVWDDSKADKVYSEYDGVFQGYKQKKRRETLETEMTGGRRSTSSDVASKH
jgi:hypothetical protein